MSAKKFTIGLAVGTVIGAIVGLLFAPKSGKETRQLLAAKAKKIKEKISKTK
jgi:gas vesicle protein